MPQIRTLSMLLSAHLLLFVLALSGCGDSNTNAGLNQSTGKHEAGWLPSGHKETARSNISECTGCHGADLNGGISKVSCTQCHLGNALSVHPVLWGNLAYAFHGDYVKSSGNTSCSVASCHGTNLQGVAGSGPSCANCHMAGTAQAPQKHAWTATTTGENIAGHIAYFNANPINYSTCRNNACHGGAGTTAPPPGVFLSGPSCLTCHTSPGTPGNPLPTEN